MSFGAQYVIFFIFLVAAVGVLYACTSALLWWTGRARAEASPASARASGVQQAPMHAHGTPSARTAPDYGAWMHAQGAPALDWLHEMNDRPDVAPHIAAVGPSGSGKSTLILAALSRRPGQIVITTPKSAADDPWGGFPAVRSVFGADFQPSYKAIGEAWQAVYLEMNKRHADGSRPRTPLTLVVDEFTTSLHELRSLDPQQLFIRMWLMGRSVGVRLITMDPTMNVKGWGIEGRGDVRESILFVRTERDKSARFFEWDARANRPCNERAFDTAQVPALAAQGLDGARLWVPDAPPVQATTPTAVHASAPSDARFNAPTAPEPTVHEVALVQAWADEGDPSLRQLARQLYAARGGMEAYKGDGGPFYAVKAALAAPVLTETL